MVFKTKRIFFTLIEIMIVMIIVISLVAVVGYNVKNGLQEQNFRSQVDRILTQLRMSQDMLMLLNIETTLVFENGEIKWIPVGTTSQLYDKMLARENFKPTAFKEIIFESQMDESSSVRGKEGTITLSYLDRGFRTPFGVLKFISADTTSYIFLRGYPSPLFVESTEPNVNEARDKQRAFIEQLTASTWGAIDVQKAP